MSRTAVSKIVAFIFLFLPSLLSSTESNSADSRPASLLPLQAVTDFFRVEGETADYINFIGVTSEGQLCEVSVGFKERDLLVDVHSYRSHFTSYPLRLYVNGQDAAGNFIATNSEINGDALSIRSSKIFNQPQRMGLLIQRDGSEEFVDATVTGVRVRFDFQKDDHNGVGAVSETYVTKDKRGKQKDFPLYSCNLKKRFVFYRKSTRFLLDVPWVKEVGWDEARGVTKP